jgi:hypothetical protein
MKKKRDAQIDLFKGEVTLDDICSNANEYIEIYEQNNVKYEVVNVSDVTFKSGTKEGIHSWFRLTPSYSPELVRFFIDYLECDKKHIVFDPFNGKGTTIVECQKLGYESIAIELNPLLYNVTNWTLKWDYNLTELSELNVKIHSQFSKLSKKAQPLSIEEFEKKFKLNIPKIHNPFRWWKENVIKDLLLLKKVIYDLVEQENIGFYNIILSVISLDCANIHRNHPTISFDDNHTRDIDVWKEYENNFNKQYNDIEEVQKIKVSKKAVIINGDSTKMASYLEKKIDRLITSPPYPNRFSYIHTTRPQLFFMELIEDGNEATELDIKAIGGTWGRATSILQKEFLEPNEGISEFLTYIPELKEKSLLMCNYATKYFNMMDDHIKELRTRVNKGFRGVYVVGNSRLSGVEIYTEIILGRIFEKQGFHFDKVVVFRKRGGKKKLYETGVIVSL